MNGVNRTYISRVLLSLKVRLVKPVVSACCVRTFLVLVHVVTVKLTRCRGTLPPCTSVRVSLRHLVTFRPQS